MEPSWYATARELLAWAETPVGALVVYPSVLAAGVGVGYSCRKLRCFLSSLSSPENPQRKPPQGKKPTTSLVP